jgi:hypothetical protein
MPRLLREIIRGVLDDDPAFELAGELDGPRLTTDAVASTGADFVITGSETSGDRDIGAHLMRDARVKVLAVSADAQTSFLYVPLGEVAPARLLAVIRAAAKPPLGGRP